MILSLCNVKENYCLLCRYFASDCGRYFPGIRKETADLNEAICKEGYSGTKPTRLGTIVYKVLPKNVNILRNDCRSRLLPYHKIIQDLLKATNIRIVMTALNTVGDDNMEDHKVKCT